METWGLWGRGARHVLKVGFEQPPRGGFVLDLGVVLVDPASQVAVSVNSLPSIAHWIAPSDDPQLRVIVEPDAVGEARTFEITLRPATPRTPLELSGVPDSRPFGVGLRWLHISEGIPPA